MRPKFFILSKTVLLWHQSHAPRQMITAAGLFAPHAIGWCWEHSGKMIRLSRENLTDRLWKVSSPQNTTLIFLPSQFSSVAQSCPTLCDPKNLSTPGLPVHHQLLEFTHTHVPQVSDAIQPSHPLSSPSPPAPNPSQHQSLFQRVNSSHEVAKVLEFQL